MRIGYARLSEEDQTLPLQRQAIQVPVKVIAARFGIAPSTVYRNLTETAKPDGSHQGPTAYA